MSSTSTFLCSLLHYCLCCKEGKYSRSQRRQNKSARYCTCRQRRTLLLSFFENLPGGTEDPGCSSSRWLGVSASRSLGSSDTFVIGRPFTIDSTSHTRVLIPSSSIVCSLINALNTFLTVLIHLSHTPPWWELLVG